MLQIILNGTLDDLKAASISLKNLLLLGSS